MTGGLLDGDIFRGLAFRILLFLTLALLPFGLIAVFQTREIARQADFNSELSLVALTNQAANSERSILLEGFGAAYTLSETVKLYRDDPAGCSEFLASFIGSSDTYLFAGYVPPNGMMLCSSDGAEVNFADMPGLKDRMEARNRLVQAIESPVVSRESVVTLSQPLYSDGDFAGYMVISVPQSLIKSDLPRLLNASTTVDLVTFNSMGELVRASRGREAVQANLPANRALAALVGQDSLVFHAENMAGEDRVYTVVPIVSDVAYSLSIWHPEDMGGNIVKSVGFSIFLPVLMWLASLVVAFWSLNRLAVRHIRKLGRQMRHFAYNRRVPHTSMGQGVPLELLQMQQSFVRMAESIVRDEAALEDSLRDKNILLKEVHHRVKNNLQMISSIMNMQIRRAQSDDARAVLKRLQDRILSLATVHQNLYQAEALDRVDAGALLEQIIGQLLRVGLPAGRRIEVTQEYDSFDLDADDAAPLTLLASEAVTNALKYIGPAKPGGKSELVILLKQEDENTIKLQVANSISGNVSDEGTGLGTQLISAFARQLNGSVEANFEGTQHVLELVFPLQQRVKARYDY